MTAFDDLLSANEEFSATFSDAELTGRAARGLAVVTCMDSRIDPLGVFDLKPGDAKICATPAPGSPTTYCVRSYWRSICWESSGCWSCRTRTAA